MADRKGNGPPGVRSPRFPRSKFHAPSAPSRLVRRSRLLDALDRGRQARLTLVVGSPGAGKTALLADWLAAHPERPTAWLSCDPADAVGARFVAAIIEALRRASDRAELGEDARQLLSLDGEVSADVIAALADDLDGLAGPSGAGDRRFPPDRSGRGGHPDLVVGVPAGLSAAGRGQPGRPGPTAAQDASQRRAGRVAGPGSVLLRRRDQTLPVRVRSASERAGPQASSTSAARAGSRACRWRLSRCSTHPIPSAPPVESSCTATAWPGIFSTRSSTANLPSWSSSCWPPRSSTNCRCRPATPCAARGRPPSSSSSTATTCS